jgi:hypothetical protein
MISDSDSDIEYTETETKVTKFFNGFKETKDTNAHSYIIHQNDCLHSKVKSLEDKIVKLNSKIKELEQENESMEVSKENLKHYIRNEHELAGYHKGISEIYEARIKQLQIEYNKMYMKDLGISSVFLVCVMCGFYMDARREYYDTLLLCLEISFIYIALPFFKTLMNFFEVRKDNVYNKYAREIINASNGIKYLDELINKF